MGNEWDNNAKSYNGIDVSTMVNTTFENFSLAYTNETLSTILTVKEVTKNQNGEALTGDYFAFETSEDTALTLGYPNSANLGSAATKNDAGEFYNSAIYNIELNNNCTANIKSYSVPSLFIRYNHSSTFTRFKAYQNTGSTTVPVYIYKLNHTYTNQIEKFEIQADSNGCYIGETINFSFKENSHRPSFIDLPADFAANLTYNSSNTDVATIENTGVLTAKTVGNTTITASYKVSDELTITSLPITISVREEIKIDGNFYKVKNVSELSVDDKIMIVADNYNVAVGPVVNKYYSSGVSVSRVGSEIAYNAATNYTAVITVEEGSNNTFAFKTSEGYLSCSETGTYSNLMPINSISNISSWNVSIDGSNTTITAIGGENTNKTIGLSVSHGTFASYTTVPSSGIDSVSIYKLYGDLPCTHTFANGKCTKCDAIDPNYVEPEIGSTATITFDDISKRVNDTWSENGISVKYEGTTNSYAKPARFYKNSTITISSESFIKIEFICNDNDYAASLKTSLGTSLGSVNVSGKIVTLTLSAANTEIEITLSAGQVRMDSLTCFYA